AASLNSLVNCLRDKPMTQFSIRWILSLIPLSQKWGQVQIDPLTRALLEPTSIPNSGEINALPQVIPHACDRTLPLQ
ncbi:MAG: hypothetical protein ACLGQX_12270, partial [Acidobacteriota bacterium]